MLDEHCFFCLVKLAGRLVNDDVAKCRKFVALTLRKLLEGVSESSLEDVVGAGCDWLENEKESSRVIGVEVLVQVSFVEGVRFVHRLPRILKAISELLDSADLFMENRFVLFIF